MNSKRIPSLDEYIIETISTGSSMRHWRPEEVIGKAFMMSGDHFEIKDFIASKESFYAQMKREKGQGVGAENEENGIIYGIQRGMAPGIYLPATDDIVEQIFAGEVTLLDNKNK